MSSIKEKVKGAAATGVMGLNAAAIIFLYTHFVPRVEYDKLEAKYERHLEKYEEMSHKVVVQEAALEVLQGLYRVEVLHVDEE